MCQIKAHLKLTGKVDPEGGGRLVSSTIGVMRLIVYDDHSMEGALLSRTGLFSVFGIGKHPLISGVYAENLVHMIIR